MKLWLQWGSVLELTMLGKPPLHHVRQLTVRGVAVASEFRCALNTSLH